MLFPPRRIPGIENANLGRSDFTSWSDDLYREDRIGGVPVLRIRGFSERHEEEKASLEAFLNGSIWADADRGPEERRSAATASHVATFRREGVEGVCMRLWYGEDGGSGQNGVGDGWRGPRCSP